MIVEFFCNHLILRVNPYDLLLYLDILLFNILLDEVSNVIS